jgi:pimeloyl-ACP methyl ester carboxylesterase
MTATAVLVHGAWSGAWIWERVLPPLATRGVRALAVDLPSVGDGAVGLDGDVATVREALDRVEGDILLCGHSYGGMVITGAAAGHERVRRLLYLCAFMPAEGQSLLGLLGGQIPPTWRVQDDRTVLPAAPPPPDLDPDTRAMVTDSRRPQSLRAYTQPPAAIAWRTIPSTYAIATNDQAMPVERQRSFAIQATEVVELPTGHQPMLARPELVVDLIARLAVTPPGSAPAAGSRRSSRR